MATTLVQKGDLIEVVAPRTVNSGDLVLVGSIFGIAQVAAASGATVLICVVGVHSLPKATGAWSQGDLIYFDNTAFNCTKTSSGNHLVGAATAAALSGDATGTVRLNSNAVLSS